MLAYNLDYWAEQSICAAHLKLQKAWQACLVPSNLIFLLFFVGGEGRVVKENGEYTYKIKREILK